MDIFKMLDKKRAEIIFILIFVFFAIFLKIGQPWNYSIAHAHPQFFNANDNFFHASLSEYVKVNGSAAFTPIYMVGGYGDVVGYQPPLLHHLSAMVSNLTGLQTYDTTYIVVIFLTCFGYILVYFAIKKVNETLAILSLPFMLGIYAFAFEIANAFGMSVFVIGSFFVFAFLWCMENFERKYSFILLALFLSGMAIGHTTEMIFSLGFLVFYLAVRFFKNGLDKKEIRSVVLGILIFAVISVYYLIIFYYTWMKAQPFVFSVMEQPAFAPGFPVTLGSFGVTQFFIYIGMLFFVFMLLVKEDSDKVKVKAASPVILAGVFFLVIGFTNYIGFGVRAFQTRIFWPVYLSSFMGLAIYFIPARFGKWKSRYVYAIAGLLLVIFFFNHYGGLQSGGLIDQKTWDGFMWIKENTPENASVFHFYSALITQPHSIFATERVPYYVNLDDYIDGIKNQVVKKEYKSDIFALDDTNIPYRNGLFSYGYHINDPDYKNRTPGMWNMDYYFLVVGGSDPNPNLITYNRYVGQYLLNQTWIEPAYANDEVVILKNKEPGRKPT